jgi:type IV pilus assembly protein PilE
MNEPGEVEKLIHAKRTRSERGFSLPELLIVLVVAAVLAAIAYPSYQQQVRKSRRSAATAALIDAASRQEQFFLDNKTYTTTINAGGLNVSSIIESGTYSLSVDAPTGACPLDRCYRVRATPQGAQAADSCGALTVDSERVKTPDNCW